MHKSNIDMEIFIGTFKAIYNEEKNYKIVYPKGIKNKNNHDYKDVVIKNIGKSDIDCLDIILTNKRSIILCDYKSLDNLVNYESVCYNCCYDKKIRVDESVKIRIYFEKNKQPYTSFSSTLAFLLKIKIIIIGNNLSSMKKIIYMHHMEYHIKILNKLYPLMMLMIVLSNHGYGNNKKRL